MRSAGSPYYEEISEKRAYNFLRQPWKWKNSRFRKVFMVMMHQRVMVLDNRSGGCSSISFPTIMEAQRYCEDVYDGGYG